MSHKELSEMTDEEIRKTEFVDSKHMSCPECESPVMYIDNLTETTTHARYVLKTNGNIDRDTELEFEKWHSDEVGKYICNGNDCDWESKDISNFIKDKNS